MWALNKYFPNVKTFVRAHDVDHGLNLEKAGATAVFIYELRLFTFFLIPVSNFSQVINEKIGYLN